VSQAVLDQARIAFSSPSAAPASPTTNNPTQDKGEATEGEEQGQEAQELEESSKDFRTIDKDKWEEILSQLEADDFKYKM
ncbi:MAG: hypothetical protein WCN89_06770, partial [bacterium]